MTWEGIEKGTDRKKDKEGEKMMNRLQDRREKRTRDEPKKKVPWTCTEGQALQWSRVMRKMMSWRL